MNRFCRYTRRTTDVDAARSFYDALFGDAFWNAGLELEKLPAQAAARGAPPRWLGHIGVSNVNEIAARFAAMGATRLGPPGTANGEPAILRDPLGATPATWRPRARP